MKLPECRKSMSLKQPASFLTQKESGTTMDSRVFLRSRSNQTPSPDSSRSIGLPVKNLILSNRIHRDGIYPRHSHSSSENSLSGVAGNEHGLDTKRISLRSSEDKFADSGERSLDSDAQLSMLKEVPSNAGSNEQSSRGHNRKTSASSKLSNSNVSQRIPSDGHEVPSQASAYSSDASGEVMSVPRPAATFTAPQREPKLPSLSETRSHSHERPPERFVPRIVSSTSSETGADLSGVETEVLKLVEGLKSPSLDEQRNATAALRLLAKHNMENRIVIANCGAVSLLVNLLHSTDTRIQENAVTALLNISINANNKTVIANADAIEPLIHVLDTGSPEAKENSAATLYSLSVIEDNKAKIGRSGAIKPLVDLLGNGTPRGKKDATTALFYLSTFHENKPRIVQAGAVKYLVELMDPAAGLVDKAVAVLSNLSTMNEGREAIGREGGIPVLVEVVELGSARGKENAAAALLQLSINSNRFCNLVLQEGAVPPLVVLSKSGTPRAKEKAQSLLIHFRNQRRGNAGRG